MFKKLFKKKECPIAQDLAAPTPKTLTERLIELDTSVNFDTDINEHTFKRGINSLAHDFFMADKHEERPQNSTIIGELFSEVLEKDFNSLVGKTVIEMVYAMDDVQLLKMQKLLEEKMKIVKH